MTTYVAPRTRAARLALAASAAAGFVLLLLFANNFIVVRAQSVSDGSAPSAPRSVSARADIEVSRSSATGVQAKRRVSLLVTGGPVVTVDAARRLIPVGGVAIDGTSIVAVDDAAALAARFDANETIDARGGIILPGLINTHTHVAMVMYRGLADDMALMEWLQRYIFPAEAKTLTPAFVRAGARLGVLEMIQSGTTAFADMYYFEEETAAVVKAAGLRGVLGQTVIDFPVADAKTPADALARAERFFTQWSADELVTPAVAPHSMYTLDARWLRAARALAQKYDKPVLIHLAETRDEVKISQERFHMSPTAYLESLGFWGPKTVAAHAVWAPPEDLPTLKKHGVGLVHNPGSNMKLASGQAPVQAWLDAGLASGLGTDGAASSNDLDMFAAMRLASFLGKIRSDDPRALPAAVVLEMATLGGAKVLGLDRLIGSLEAGKRADLIVASVRGARQTPLYDPVSHLVYAAHGDDVETVVVNGKIIMRDRRVLTMDERAVLEEARRMSAGVRDAVR